MVKTSKNLVLGMCIAFKFLFQTNQSAFEFGTGEHVHQWIVNEMTEEQIRDVRIDLKNNRTISF